MGGPEFSNGRPLRIGCDCWFLKNSLGLDPTEGRDHVKQYHYILDEKKEMRAPTSINQLDS